MFVLTRELKRPGHNVRWDWEKAESIQCLLDRIEYVKGYYKDIGQEEYTMTFWIHNFNMNTGNMELVLNPEPYVYVKPKPRCINPEKV